MKQRLIASGIVFSVGFGIGLGLTWALLAKKPSADDATHAATDGPAADELEAAPNEAAAGPASDSLREPAVDTLAPTETAPGDAVVAPQPGSAVDPSSPQRPVESPAAAETPTDDLEADDPEADDPEADDPEADDSEEAAPEIKTNAWWKGLVGRRATVDLGKTKALSVRKGLLKDGDVLDWGRRFGTADKLGTLYNGDPNVATVHGVATNSAGTPVAAQVSITAQGREITGIIALHTQGLKITLRPVDDGKDG